MLTKCYFKVVRIMADETIGSLVVRIEANIKNAVAGMDTVERKISALSSQAESKLGPIMDKVGTAFKVIGTAAAAGFGAAIVGGVKGAAQLESYRNTLNTVMKDSKKAGEVMAWAVDFANKTPFETDSIVQATVRLQSYGLEAQKVMPSVGNMASVMNKDIMQAVEAVADAQTGEVERLKEFGITKQMIIDQAAKTMKGKQIINDKGQITDQENFNKALFSLMDERFKGGMEKQASSFTGLWSTVKGTFATTLATMAGISETGEVKIGGFFDKLKTKMQVIIDKIAEWQKNGQLQEWANKAGSALTTFWNIGEDIFNKLIETGKFIKDNWGLIEPILAGILAGYVAFKTITGILKAIEMAQAALNLVMAANPIALVVLAIAALVAGGILLYKNWDTIKAKAQELWDKIKAVWESVKTKTSEVWNGIKTSLKDSWQSIIDWGSKKWQGFKDMFLGVFDAIGKGIKGYVNIYISALNFFIRALNKINFSIPDWVPELGGKSFGINIPQIPKLAKGTNFVPFDTTAFLHKGEAVVPANNNPSNPGSNNPVGQSINYAGMFDGATFNIRSDNDVKMLAREIFNLQTARSRGNGVVYGT